MSIFNLLYIFGSVGIFIYGMILLSDSLENAAGESLKKILSTMTNNRFLGLFTGFLVTSVIQSSSATTVMVVSFVNAGLLNLSQAIGVIMGANIGTTVTAWIINLTNLKINMTMIAYTAVIVGIILKFMKKRKLSLWGHALLGFAFIFIGLDLLKSAVPKPTGLNEGNFLYDFFNWIPKDSYWFQFLFILIGAGLTVIVQSSSVMMAFTITIASQGYIDFYNGAAMVLGENIGTTITALLASIAGNKMAKRAALAHCLFNIIGVFWITIPFIFNAYTSFCTRLAGNVPGVELALFHSFFNISNAALLIWFVPQIEWLLTFTTKKDTIRYGLLTMDKGLITTPELALLEAAREIEKITTVTKKVFFHTDKLLTGERDKQYGKIRELRERMQLHSTELSKFLNSITSSQVSANTVESINNMLLHTKILDNIACSCEKISALLKKSDNLNVAAFLKSEDELNKLIYKISTMFTFLENKQVKTGKDIYALGVQAEEDIDKHYWKLKRHTISAMKKKGNKSTIANGLIFLDIIKELEHIGDDLQKILTINYEDEFVQST